MKALDICNLSFSYPERPSILQDLNFKILPGEKVGLIGPNGAGKTTLFLLVCGILSPTRGEIKVFDKLIEPGKFRHEIGLVFQNPDDQLFCPAVKEDVAFGPENMGKDAQEIDMRVENALSLTGVSHLAERIPYQLSAGEKCMVAIASVLSMHPKIILYDEPSANLDLQARRGLIEFLQRAKEVIILSSHDLELILEVCERVILLNRGKIVADGIPQQIIDLYHKTSRGAGNIFERTFLN